MAFEIHFLPYGRVDAILMRCDGKTAFIDSGYRKNGIAAVKYMRALGIVKLDAYIATHRHKNHVGGAPYIIEAMRPENVYTIDARMQDRLIGLASGTAEKTAVREANFVIVQTGDVFSVGGAICTCVGPDKLRSCPAGALAENYNSMILRVCYGARSLLLTGDTSSGIMAKAKNIRAEVYKNAHHGGNQALSVLKKIAPTITVICSNKACSTAYKKRLAAAGCKTVYSAVKKKDGIVVLQAGPGGWERK